MDTQAPAARATTDSQRVAGRTLVPRWLWPIGLAVAALVACVALAVADPQRRAELAPGCPFRTVTGLDCPGCGGTRAVYALTQGNVWVAFEHNALTMTLAPVLGWVWWRWLMASTGRREFPTTSPRVAWTLCITIIGFWVLRNVPVWPLSWLGSTAG